MSETKSTTSNGIGFTGLLTIAFVVLKLTNVIEWSWWWVLSPVWISLVLAVVIATGYLVILFLYHLLKEIAKLMKEKE